MAQEQICPLHRTCLPNLSVWLLDPVAGASQTTLSADLMTKFLSDLGGQGPFTARLFALEVGLQKKIAEDATLAGMTYVDWISHAQPPGARPPAEKSKREEISLAAWAISKHLDGVQFVGAKEDFPYILPRGTLMVESAFVRVKVGTRVGMFIKCADVIQVAVRLGIGCPVEYGDTDEWQQTLGVINDRLKPDALSAMAELATKGGSSWTQAMSKLQLDGSWKKVAVASADNGGVAEEVTPGQVSEKLFGAFEKDEDKQEMAETIFRAVASLVADRLGAHCGCVVASEGGGHFAGGGADDESHADGSWHLRRQW